MNCAIRSLEVVHLIAYIDANQCKGGNISDGRVEVKSLTVLNMQLLMATCLPVQLTAIPGLGLSTNVMSRGYVMFSSRLF